MKKDFSPDESVCVGVLGKLATFTTWRKPYFYVTFFTFSLLYVVFDSVPHNDLLFDLWFFCSSVFIAYSIKICILFTLYLECVYLSLFS